MKYCKFCGAEIPDGGMCSCDEAQNDIASQKSVDNKSKINPGIALIAGLVIIISCLGVAFNDGGYEKPVSQFFNGFNKCDSSMIAKSLPKNAADEFEKQMSDENLESMISLLEIAYGKNIKISYEIEDKNELSKNEIKALEKSSGLDIKDAYDLTVEIDFKGKKEEKETKSVITVAKVKGEGWKIVDNIKSLLE